MNNQILNNFGLIIQRERKKLKISQEELAFRAGLHRTYIGMIERGEKNITLINIHKLANALQIPLSKLFEEKI
ncbi:helix-turn-helix domain-containing protein [Myroides pelagicus]|uniref:Helix-turn-helix domain-containing protein n=1 Tax=Myroides pelagicus TaxID=270914 RepID=A0A7K1GQ10_9FLAO|nr:helix-turn-helix transcriptional regulator [Myroides pelagicus]MTH30820.1 helix-turn-helix domain-containing protein [Myroides pelagicus]